MATAATAKVKAQVTYTYSKADTITTVEHTHTLTNETSYTYGTGDSQYDVLYRRTYTVTANTDVTLYNTLTDIYGDTVNVEILRAIYIHNKSTTSGDNIYVGPLSCSNPLLAPWVNADGKNKVGPGGTLLIDCPKDGYTLADDADTIRLQYQGTSGSIDVEFLVLGSAGDYVSSSSSSTSSSSTSSTSSSSTKSESSSSTSSSSSSTAAASRSSSSSSSSKSSQSSSSTSTSTVQMSGSSSSSTSSSST